MGIRDRLKKRLGRGEAKPQPRTRPSPRPAPPPEPAGRRSSLLRAELAGAAAAPKPDAPPAADAPTPTAAAQAPAAQAPAVVNRPAPAPDVSPPDEPTPDTASASAPPPAEGEGEAEVARYTVRVLSPDGEPELLFTMRSDEFVCDGADRAGLEVPSSCRSGGCLVCCGKLIEGEVEMGEQYVLEDEDIAAGFRLLCCTELRSDAVFISHQEHEVGG